MALQQKLKIFIFKCRTQLMLSALLLDKPCFSSVKVSLDPQTEVIKQFTTVEPRQCDHRWAIKS